MNIDIKLKTYEQLQHEVMTLNTNGYLKDLKIDKLQSNWNSLREWLESEYNRYLNDTENLIHSNVEVIDFSRMLDKMNELEGVKND